MMWLCRIGRTTSCALQVVVNSKCFAPTGKPSPPKKTNRARVHLTVALGGCHSTRELMGTCWIAIIRGHRGTAFDSNTYGLGIHGRAHGVLPGEKRKSCGGGEADAVTSDPGKQELEVWQRISNRARDKLF